MSAQEPPDASTEVAEDRVARNRARRAAATADEEVPKLPRGRGFKVSRGQLIKIVLTGGLLVMLLVIQRPCAESVSSFVTGFDDQGSASARMPKPGNVDPAKPQQFEPLHDNLTEAEWKAMVQRSNAANRGPENKPGSGGSAAPEKPAPGSGAP